MSCVFEAPMATDSASVWSGTVDGRASDLPAVPGSGIAWGARGQRHPRKLAHDGHVPTFLPFSSSPQSGGRSTATSTAKRPASARLKQQAKRRRKSPSPLYSPSPSPPPQRRKARAAARSPSAEPGLSLPQIQEQECTILAAINQAALQKKLSPEVAESFQAQLNDLAVLKHRLDPAARQRTANRYTGGPECTHQSCRQTTEHTCSSCQPMHAQFSSCTEGVVLHRTSSADRLAHGRLSGPIDLSAPAQPPAAALLATCKQIMGEHAAAKAAAAAGAQPASRATPAKAAVIDLSDTLKTQPHTSRHGQAVSDRSGMAGSSTGMHAPAPTHVPAKAAAVKAKVQAECKPQLVRDARQQQGLPKAEQPAASRSTSLGICLPNGIHLRDEVTPRLACQLQVHRMGFCHVQGGRSSSPASAQPFMHAMVP